MKSLSFVLSFFISSSLCGQVIFEPTFINQCSNQIDESPSWVISDSTNTDWHWPDNNKSNKATLPKPGNYKIHINYDEPIEFTINKIGIMRDTFVIKRLTHHSYRSPHPLSNYSDCDSSANGKIFDYYYNGKMRRKGTFKDGKGIDTLFSYFKSGQLHEIIIPNNNDWKSIKYFKNGKIASIHDTRKKYENTFYPTGQLKTEKTWSRKNKSVHKEYFPNGFLKRKQNHKELEIYNQDKVVVEKMKRKEILIFERMFAKKKHGREKFYAYKWESFDARGIIKRKIIFDNDHFEMKPFPDSIQQINDFLFEKIIFYFNGKEFKKVAIEYDIYTDFSKKLVVYRKEEKNWIKEKTTSISKVYEMIDNYTN